MTCAEIIQGDCDASVTAAGVMHCIVKHVPAAANGSLPVVSMQTLRGGEVLVGGSNASSGWISDDAEGVTGVTLELSRDGGATWAELGTGLDGDGEGEAVHQRDVVPVQPIGAG